MAQICRDMHMPAVKTVALWAEQDTEISTSIAAARVEGYDVLAAQCLQIADTPVLGVEEKVTPALKNQQGDVVVPESVELKRGDMLGHRKLQIETRLKLLAKWDPKRYGDRLNLDVQGSLAIAEMSEEDIRAELAQLTGGGVAGRLNLPDDGSDLV